MFVNQWDEKDARSLSPLSLGIDTAEANEWSRSFRGTCCNPKATQPQFASHNKNDGPWFEAYLAKFASMQLPKATSPPQTPQDKPNQASIKEFASMTHVFSNHF